eukprot:TRINITY_DN81777_c0_g1_i1.p1 TRINITY_DN81777_c0_g1~~TRINITY_DN81777_c0_g1_i1.p1  ORF type:complete len:436 (+),score=111.40 TRINITY_DN81777_c0_g1_i1:52-1308(+)
MAAAAADAATAVAAIAQKNANRMAPGEDLELLEPEQGVSAAREATAKLHEVLNRLKEGLPNRSAEGESKEFNESAQELQRQLLALRRAHAAMVKRAENGRVLEAAARRATDNEYAHLETRQYENACCRAATRRCRNLPTPQLNLLRPLLEGFQDEGQDEALDATGSSRLAGQLEAERLERTRLGEELEGLEKKRRAEMVAFAEREKLGSELTAKLAAVDRALEPVCDLLEVRPRTGTEDGLASKLPAPLRLVFSKFSAIEKEQKITVTIEEVPSEKPAEPAAGTEEAPPEKRRRTEAEPEQLSVAVKIQDAATVRFTNPSQSLVAADAEGSSGENLLDDLWPEDDGRHGAVIALLPSAALEKGGRPYGWAQILAGLREEALAAVPALYAMESIKADEVVSRIRSKLQAAGTNGKASPS